jgi:hypothetical protein
MYVCICKHVHTYIHLYTAVECDVAVPNGQLLPSCIPNPSHQCEFSCVANYRKLDSVTMVTCQLDSTWDVPLDQLCIGKYTAQNF